MKEYHILIKKWKKIIENKKNPPHYTGILLVIVKNMKFKTQRIS